MDTSQPDRRPYVALFIKPKTFEKLPVGYDEAWSTVQSAEKTSTERLFLDHGGVPVWFVHFLAKKHLIGGTGGHFYGQATGIQLLRAFEAEPVDCRISVAREVKEALPSEIQTKIWALVNKPRKRQRTEDSPDENGEQQGSSLQTSIVLANDNNVATDTLASDLFFSLGKPSVQTITNVFPSLLASAISRLPPPSTGNSSTWTAAVTISFIQAKYFGNTTDSLMSLNIMNNKVENLAMRLFGVHVESNDKHRYLVLSPIGQRVVPTPEIVVRGCKRELILELFGEVIATAVKASLTYKREEEQGIPLTECVSMTITHRASDEAIINLSLAEREGFLLKETLWPKPN